MTSQNCPVCNSNHLKIKYNLFDDRYGYPGIFSLVKCDQCSHIYLDSNFSDDQLTDLYTNYYPRTSLSINDYKPSPKVKGFKSWLNGEKRSAYTWVPKNVRILDIGCGFGETLGYHQARGCDVYGVEADENIKRVADKFGYNVHVGLFDSTIYNSSFFDFVTMDQVIEHVTNPLDTLLGISKILKDNGILILSTPNPNGWGTKIFGKRWINWHTPYHLNFFTKKSLSLIAKKTDLKIFKIKTITSSEWLFYQLVHLVLYPKCETPSNFWKPNNINNINISKRIFLKLCRVLHKLKITHIITRIFDCLNIGDNFIIFLKKKDG